MSQTGTAPFETTVVRRKVSAKSLIDGRPRTAFPEYQIWIGIITRCMNENHHSYSRYGGRGIKICAAWHQDFENFYRDMGPRPSRKHSIDRIDNDGNYEPGNCRWATPREQVLNSGARTNAWTESDYETLRRMYLGHYSYEQIAIAIDRSVGTVKLRLHGLGLHRDAFLTRLARKNPDFCHLLHGGDRDGFLRAVTTRKELRALKAESQRRAALRQIAAGAQEIHRSSESRNVKMRLMREAGMSLSAIGKQFGVTRERVRQIEEAGFPEHFGSAAGDRRKVSATKPAVLRKRIDRLCRAWNAASREARVAFLAAAPECVFMAISVDIVEQRHAEKSQVAA